MVSSHLISRFTSYSCNQFSYCQLTFRYKQLEFYQEIYTCLIFCASINQCLLILRLNKIIMKSLKTDDILGARPRIRHPPKNVIRENYIGRYQYANHQPHSINEIHMSESFQAKSPAGKPYYKDPAPYQGYLASLNPHNNPKMQLPSHERSQQNPYRNRENGKYILPKDVPRVSYEQKTIPLKKQPRYSVNQILQRRDSKGTFPKQINSNIKNVEQNSPPSSIKESHEYYKERQGSAKSSSKSIQQKPKNIFRGLGYNIITNHKFAYDMQNTRVNHSSKWLD